MWQLMEILKENFVEYLKKKKKERDAEISVGCSKRIILKGTKAQLPEDTICINIEWLDHFQIDLFTHTHTLYIYIYIY